MVSHGVPFLRMKPWSKLDDHQGVRRCFGMAALIHQIGEFFHHSLVLFPSLRCAYISRLTARLSATFRKRRPFVDYSSKASSSQILLLTHTDHYEALSSSMTPGDELSWICDFHMDFPGRKFKCKNVEKLQVCL